MNHQRAFVQFSTLLSFLLFSYIPVVTAQTCIFEDDFETAVLAPPWTARPAIEGVADGVVEIVTLPFDGGQYGVRMGKLADSGFTRNCLDLQLDLSGLTEVFLQFSIRNNGDETHVEDGLFFSDDGGTSFVQFYAFKPGQWCGNAYGSFPPFDIGALTASAGLSLTSNFVIRWQQYDNADFNSGFGLGERDGWYLDNVCVYESTLTYETLPYMDDFQAGIFGPEWNRGFAEATSFPATDVDNPLGVVEIVSGGSNFEVRMGKRCDQTDILTANALDLHLNLEGKTKVELTFDIKTNGDETHIQDGLWFSDDGGANFEPVFSFKPALWCAGVYGSFPPIDVDSLAAAAGLALSSHFVIRWQQYDNADFNSGTGLGERDGWYLDNIKVYESGVTYASVPFEEDFSAGVFRAAWKRGFAQPTSFPAQDVDSPMGIAELVISDDDFAARMGKRCDQVEVFNSTALDLHIDLEGHQNLKLKFDIKTNGDETHIHDRLLFSDDGGVTFVPVYSFKPASWCANIFGSFPPFDVDVLAAAAGLSLTSTFVMRWQQHDNSDFSAGFGGGERDGLYLDNINVYTSEPTYVVLPFMDDFESGIMSSAWSHSFADQTSLPQENVSAPTGVVAVITGGLESQFAVGMGKICDQTDEFVANAFDLHVNLLDRDSVFLTFDIFNNGDENHIQDGLYLSNDGGETFSSRVYPFDFTVLPVAWKNLALDLDSLAQMANVTYTERFVIRFQQYDNADFGAGFGGGERDGIRIDNVLVTGNTTTSVASPVQEVKRLFLFPNPVNDRLQIKHPTDFNPAYSSQIKIIDKLGRVMLSKIEHIGAGVDVSSLPGGLYFVIITNGPDTYAGKFMKS